MCTQVLQNVYIPSTGSISNKLLDVYIYKGIDMEREMGLCGHIYTWRCIGKCIFFAIEIQSLCTTPHVFSFVFLIVAIQKKVALNLYFYN